MELDPIVLLAYVSVAINIITIIAAVVAYVVFKIRKRNRRQAEGGDAPPAGPVEPVFIRPYRPTMSIAGPVESAGDRLTEER